MTAPSPAPQLRHNAAFRRLWLGAGCSQFGWRVGLAAFPLLALYATGSVAQSGLVASAAALSSLVAPLPAGIVIDRCRRRLLVAVTNLLGAVTVGAIAVAALLGTVWVPALAAAAFVEGTRGVVIDLAERAMVRGVVAPAHLPRALSQNEARRQAMGLAGQPLGGVLLTLAQALPFVVVSALDALAALSVLGLRDADPEVRPRAGAPGAELVAGVRWVARRPLMRVLVGAIAASNFVFQILVLTMMFRLHAAGQSPTAVSLVLGCAGAGGLVGAMSAQRLSSVPVRTALLCGCLTWCVASPLVAVVPGTAAPAVLFGVIALVGGWFNVAAAVYQTTQTPSALQGRVQAVARVAGAGLNSVGAAVGGWVLSVAGATVAGWCTGAVMVVVLVAVACGPGADPDPGVVDPGAADPPTDEPDRVSTPARHEEV